MARFTIHTTSEQGKKWRRLLYVLIGGVLVYLVMALLGAKRFYPPFMVILFAICVLFPVYSAMSLMGKVRYVEIDADTIDWDTYDNKQQRVYIEWKDILWVKKEDDGSITFFQSSSFNFNLPLINFSEEDQRHLIQLVLQYAQQYNLRIVNFSEPAQAVMA
jgi:hypothetical protein